MVAITIFAILFLIASGVLCVVNSKIEQHMLDKNQEYANSWSQRDKEKSRPEEEVKKEAQEATRKLKMLVYGALAALIVIITFFNSFFITDEQQVAFTMTFGQVSMVDGAGMHFKVPYITKAYKYDATAKGMSIGYDTDSNESVVSESLMITSDFNFVNTDFYIEYRISDPIEYEFGSNNPEGILRNIALASIRNTVGLYNVDEVITTGKAEIQGVVKEQIIEKLQHHSTGLTIVNVTIQDAEPPTEEVSAAFKAVETAKQNAETAVNGAKESEQTKIPKAEAEADQILKAAEATRTERINQATQEVAEFSALFKEYLQNPDTVKKQLYYSMMEEILPDMEIIIGSDSKVIYVKNGQLVTEP